MVLAGLWADEQPSLINDALPHPDRPDGQQHKLPYLDCMTSWMASTGTTRVPISSPPPVTTPITS